MAASIPDIPRATQSTFICFSKLQRQNRELVIPSPIPVSTSPSFTSVTGIKSVSGGLNADKISITPKVENGNVSWEVIGYEQMASGDWTFNCTVKTNGNSELASASVQFTFHVRLRARSDVWGSPNRFYVEKGGNMEFASVLPGGVNPVIDYGANQELELRDTSIGKWENYTDDSGMERKRWIGEPSGLTVRFIRQGNTVTDIQVGGVGSRVGLYVFWVYRNEWTEGGQYDNLPQTFLQGSNAAPVFIEVHPRAALPVGAYAIRTSNGGAIPYAPTEAEIYSGVTWGGKTSSCVVRDPVLNIGGIAYNVNSNSNLRLDGYGLFHYYPAVRYFVPANGSHGGRKPTKNVHVKLQQRTTEDSAYYTATMNYPTANRTVKSERSFTYESTKSVGDIQERDGASVWFWENIADEGDCKYVDVYERIDDIDMYYEKEEIEVIPSGETDTDGFCRVYPASVLFDNGKNGIFAAANARAYTSGQAKRHYKKTYDYGVGEDEESSEEDTTFSASVQYHTTTLQHLFGASMKSATSGQESPLADKYVSGRVSLLRHGGYSVHMQSAEDEPNDDSIYFRATWEGETGNAITTIYQQDGSYEKKDDPDMSVFNEYKSNAMSAEVPEFDGEGIWDDWYDYSYTEALTECFIKIG